jgi:hypothetical protein
MSSITLKNKILRYFFLSISLLFFVQPSFAEDKGQLINREILIKVKPDYIALPEGEAEKIPIGAARVRSTDLRNLNEKYNAVWIEKLYELQPKNAPLEPLKIKGVKGSLTTQKQVTKKETVDLSKILTKDAKKESVEKGEIVTETKDIFSIQFELKPEIQIDDLLSEYRAVDAVLYAEAITRKSKDEKAKDDTEKK